MDFFAAAPSFDALLLYCTKVFVVNLSQTNINRKRFTVKCSRLKAYGFQPYLFERIEVPHGVFYVLWNHFFHLVDYEA